MNKILFYILLGVGIITISGISVVNESIKEETSFNLSSNPIIQNNTNPFMQYINKTKNETVINYSFEIDNYNFEPIKIPRLKEIDIPEPGKITKRIYNPEDLKTEYTPEYKERGVPNIRETYDIETEPIEIPRTPVPYGYPERLP